MKFIDFRFSLWIAAVVLLGSRPAQSADTLLSIDARNRTISINAGTTLKAYRVASPVEVRINGTATQLDQLRPGMEVVLGFADPQTVNRVQASNPSSGPLGTAMSSKRIKLKLRVDGVDVIKVRDGKLWIEHKSWSKPTDATVNTRSWKPTWDGNKSDEFITFVPPLAPFAGLPVEVKRTKGRGSATLKQSPSAANDQTLVFEVNDGTEGGADIYEVLITW